VLNGVLWVLRTGASWQDLPKRYPPYHTCHRWFQQWQQDGTLVEVLRALVADLRDRGKVDLSESFIDGSFAGAKKGALELVKRSAEKGPRSWQLQTAMVFLLKSAWPALLPTKPSS
jgi:transposase